MESRKIAPYRRLPSRVRTSLQVLEYTISIEHGRGRPSMARELDRAEQRVKHAALGCLTQYLLGEQDHADVEVIQNPDQLDAEEMLAMFGAQDGDPPCQT